MLVIEHSFFCFFVLILKHFGQTINDANNDTRNQNFKFKRLYFTGGLCTVHSKLQNAATCSCLQVKLIPTVSKWTSHSCEDGQYHHINRQVGLRSHHLNTLARRLTFPPSESNTHSKLLESGSGPMVWHRLGSF